MHVLLSRRCLPIPFAHHLYIVSLTTCWCGFHIAVGNLHQLLVVVPELMVATLIDQGSFLAQLDSLFRQNQKCVVIVIVSTVIMVKPVCCDCFPTLSKGICGCLFIYITEAVVDAAAI